MNTPSRATRDYFRRDAVTLARMLIGQRFVRILDDGTRLAGTIVETEAYLGVEDLAAHSVGGRRTARNEAMYRDAGTSYVYFTYGMHHCMNVVCGEEGMPVAVLLRAIHPTEGLERMRVHRLASRRRGAAKPTRRSPGCATVALPSLRDQDLCSGPARLCQALQIDRRQNLLDLTTDQQMWIEVVRPGLPPKGSLANTPRIGVDYARSWAMKPLRWYQKSCIHVSHRSRY